MIADNSRLAYHETQVKINGDHRIAYEQIKLLEERADGINNLPSRRDIARALNWETGRVSARVKWLIDKGFVTEANTAGKIDPLTSKRVAVLATRNWNDNTLREIAHEAHAAVYVGLDM